MVEPGLDWRFDRGRRRHRVQCHSAQHHGFQCRLYYRLPGFGPGADWRGAVGQDPINDGYLPSGSVAYGLNKYVAVGLSLTSPYSFTTSYPDGTWVSYAAGTTRLRTYDIQPSLAVVPFAGIKVIDMIVSAFMEV